MPSGSTDNSYTQGAKENDLCPTVGAGSIPPSKADLSGIYAATAIGTDAHTYLYLGWTRTDDNGTVTLDFELNQSGEILPKPACNGVNPTRTAGDKLITYNFQGGQVDSIEVRTWSGAAWGDPVDVMLSDSAEGSIGPDQRFGELVIDLEDAGIFTADDCVNFASILLKSRASSGSFTNEMKDFIAPIPRSVSNCGSLTVRKVVVDGNVGDTFSFTVDCGPDEDLNGADDGYATTFALTNGGARTFLDIEDGTSCAVTETGVSDDWTTIYTVDEVSTVHAGRFATVDISLGNRRVEFVNTAKPNGLTLDKKVNGADHATTGDALLAHTADALTYTVVITNSGQVPLTLTAMSDSLYAGLIAACPQAVGSTLAAGASVTCTYNVAAGGDAHNVASVSAVDRLNRPLTASDGTYVDVINPAITIVKTANPVSVSVSGSVTYSYVVTNTGDTTLHGVLVTDDILGALGRISTLAAGESVTMAKIVNVDATTPPTNIGTVVGTDVLGRTVTASDNATITVVLGEVLVRPAELPRTGSPLQAQTWAALALIQVGLVLTLGGRRRWTVRRAD